jgi:predicted RecB family nuclease
MGAVTTDAAGAQRADGGLLLLGAHASRRCPRRVHNDHDRTVPKVPWEPAEEVQLRLDSGIAFEAEVLDRLVALHGGRCADLRDGADWRELTEATLAAMRSGADLVVGGRLPDDPAGGRTGRPDVLLRVATGSDGVSGRYVPVEVKWHLGTEKRGKREVDVSTLAEPTTRLRVEGRAPRSSQRFDDLLQLAHYTRLLQACGFHPGDDHLTGAVLGTDRIDCGTGEDLVLVWHDLALPQFTTFSRSRGSAKRSVLERYDHEHAFRVKVAEVARRRTGSADDPEPLVVPVAQAECLTCPYGDWCAAQMGPDDPSLAITSGRLRVREWLTLQALGVTTTNALAEVDPDDDTFMATFLAEHTHDEGGAAKRLREAVRRARMRRDGVSLLRTGTDPIEVPRADVEIDLDFESDTDGRKYLWGARVVRRSPDGSTATPVYRAFVTWEALDAEGERALATELVTWLRHEIAEAGRAGRTLLVQHYTDVEPAGLRTILGADRVADVLAHFVDLHDVVRRHFVGVNGLGLKAVAPALGFGWRDDDAGGSQSQVWLQTARDPSSPRSEAMRRRVLEYNEDDVEATAVIRNALSRIASDEAAGDLSPR